MDRLVDGLQFSCRVGLSAGPYRRCHHVGPTAAPLDRALKTRPAIGAVGVNIAWIIRNDPAAGPAIIDIGRLTTSIRAVSSSQAICAL